MKNKYCPYLDLLRIIAAPSVVALHCISGFYNDPALALSRSHIAFAFINELARIGVPIFFMISGYLSLSGDCVTIGDYYRKRLPRLAVPLLFWNAIYYVFFVLIGKITPSGPDFIGRLLDSGSAYHLWFLYVSLGLALLSPFLKKITDNAGGGELLVLFVFILFPTTLRPIINQFSPLYIFLFDPLVGGYAGYFLLGYILGSKETGKFASAFIYVGGAVGFAAGFIGNLTGNAQFWNGGYSLNHYLLAAALFLFAKRRFSSPKKNTQAVVKYLSDLSFGVYLSHVLFCETFALFPVSAVFSPAIYASLQFIFALVCSGVITVIYRLFKTRFVSVLSYNLK